MITDMAVFERRLCLTFNLTAGDYGSQFVRSERGRDKKENERKTESRSKGEERERMNERRRRKIRHAFLTSVI